MPSRGLYGGLTRSSEAANVPHAGTVESATAGQANSDGVTLHRNLQGKPACLGGRSDEVARRKHFKSKLPNTVDILTAKSMRLARPINKHPSAPVGRHVGV
eukprot:6946041-Pyramimonas_sp.AAC.2